MSGDHGVRDRVGMLLVRVILPTQTARKRNTPPLLHDMGGLVHRSVEVGPAVKGDRITDGVGSSADAPAGGGGALVEVRPHAGKVVPRTERALDLLEVWQRRSRTGKPADGGFLCPRVALLVRPSGGTNPLLLKVYVAWWVGPDWSSSIPWAGPDWREASSPRHRSS